MLFDETIKNVTNILVLILQLEKEKINSTKNSFSFYQIHSIQTTKYFSFI